MGNVIAFLDKLLKLILSLIILLQAIILIAGVICRFVFNSPLTWVDESVRYLLVTVSFLGIGHVIKSKKEILVSAIDSYIPQKAARLLDFIADVIVCILMFCLIYFGIRVSLGQMAVRGESIMWIRFGYVFGMIPLGCTIGVLYLIRRWYLYFKGARAAKSIELE